MESQTPAGPRGFAARLHRGSRRNGDTGPTHRTKTIGLAVGSVANPFFGSLQRAVEDVASSHGTVVIAVSLDEDPRRESLLVSQLLERGIDGLVLSPIGDSQRYLRKSVDAGTEVVCVDRIPTGIDVDTVVCDNADAAERAVLHLASHGHRRIAYLGDSTAVWTARERERGFRQGMAKAGLTPQPPLMLTGVGNESEAYLAARSLLGTVDRPTAIFAGQNVITLGVIRALQQRGLDRETALVGFDDFAASDLIRPAVTVIAQDAYRIGEVAATTLFARLSGSTGVPELSVVPTDLIERGSGEIRAHG